MYNSAGKALAGLLFLLLSGPLAADLNEVAVLIERGNHQAALEILARQPASYRSRLLQANALAGLKRGDEAEALYRKLIDEEPGHPAPYNNLASLYAASGRLQEASELLTRAMKSDARYAVIYKNLSRVYVEMSRNSYAKALRLSEQQQGLKLLSLDHRDASSPVESLQLTAVAMPAPKEAPPAEPVAQPAVLIAKQPLKDGGSEIASPNTPPVSVALNPPTRQKPQLQPNPELQSFDAGGAIAALQQWAGAWSAQDVTAYLRAYDADYLPPDGLTQAQWRAQRRVRLQKPGRIEVSLSDFEVSSSGSDNSLTVKLLQRYRSDNYRDTTRKGFILVLRSGEWKIGDEYTIEVIN